jgi:pyruvate-formate lyase
MSSIPKKNNNFLIAFVHRVRGYCSFFVDLQKKEKTHVPAD